MLYYTIIAPPLLDTTGAYTVIPFLAEEIKVTSSELPITGTPAINTYVNELLIFYKF